MEMDGNGLSLRYQSVTHARTPTCVEGPIDRWTAKGRGIDPQWWELSQSGDFVRCSVSSEEWPVVQLFPAQMQRRLHSHTKVWCTSCSDDLVQPACGMRPAMQVQMEMFWEIATWSQCSDSADWLTCSTMHDVQNRATKWRVGKGIQRRLPARHGWRTWAFARKRTGRDQQARYARYLLEFMEIQADSSKKENSKNSRITRIT